MTEMENEMRHLILLGLILATTALSGCIIDTGPGYGYGHDRWCAVHPYRCH